MKEVVERETVYMSLETGEVVDTQYEAMELYREGHLIQVRFRNRYNNGEWGPLQYGPVWAPWDWRP